MRPHPGDSWSFQELAEAGKGVSTRAFRESLALLTPQFRTSGLQKDGRKDFRCSKAPSLW